MLTSIQEDGSIPAVLRALAREADPGYPTALALQELLVAGKGQLPLGWAESIKSAQLLFLDVQLQNHATRADRDFEALPKAVHS